MQVGKNEVFTGDGSDVKFSLKFSSTYNHGVTIDGGPALIGGLLTNTYGVTAVPDGDDYVIIRQFDGDGEPVHAIWFAVAPDDLASISVSYDVGRLLGHTLSTVGQITTDSLINEGVYGNGAVSYDPANPSSVGSGMEFRSIDKDQFFIHKFTSIAERAIEIEIVSGVNPYFVFDFVSTRYHDFMNAGIGGWSLSQLLNNNKVNDYNNIFKDFLPDIIINESATNDDWSYGSRKVSRIINGVTQAKLRELATLELNSATWDGVNYTVVSNTGIITALTKYSITSVEIVGSAVAIGDIVRIGNYYGDNKQVATREISTVDLVGGVVTFTQPLNPKLMLNVDSLSDLVGAEIAIRDLSGYADAYRDLLTKLNKASRNVKVGITQPGLSDYFIRALWGYDIIHRIVASEFDSAFVIEITDWLHDFQAGYISGDNKLDIVSNGSGAYSLTGWVGHWQGFKVFVNGIDMYGKDCYVKSGRYSSVDPLLVGAAANFNGDYTRHYETNTEMELVFTKNIPNGATITIERADGVWSGDYAHPSSTIGAMVYGQAYSDALSREL
jgi:hypothetical protein